MNRGPRGRLRRPILEAPLVPPIRAQRSPEERRSATAGIPGRARLVGRILAEDGHDLPWHRILRADGTCAPHIATEQLARLRAEGVILDRGRRR